MIYGTDLKMSQLSMQNKNECDNLLVGDDRDNFLSSNKKSSQYKSKKTTKYFKADNTKNLKSLSQDILLLKDKIEQKNKASMFEIISNLQNEEIKRKKDFQIMILIFFHYIFYVSIQLVYFFYNQEYFSKQNRMVNFSLVASHNFFASLFILIFCEIYFLVFKIKFYVRMRKTNLMIVLFNTFTFCFSFYFERANIKN